MRIMMFQTGSGWFTIKIGQVVAIGKKGGGTCDTVSYFGNKHARACDPYIKLYINGTSVLPTDEVRENTEKFNANIFYTSVKIPKTTNIKIEVRDEDEGKTDNDNHEILTASKCS